MADKAVLTISFGTSVASMRAAAIDPLEAQVAEAFNGYDAYTAWTSETIISKVREERGEMHATVEEALSRIGESDARELLAVPTCLMHGFEMRRITRTLAAWDAPMPVRLARPLLATPEDRRALAGILAHEYEMVPTSDMVLFMGHGSAKGGNEVYLHMNEVFAALGLEHFLVAVLEGQPSFAQALDYAKTRKPARVHLVPLMIVAGEHATVDMAGDADDSWASQLSARGYTPIAHIRGLGEYPAVRDLVVSHAREAQILKREGIA